MVHRAALWTRLAMPIAALIVGCSPVAGPGTGGRTAATTTDGTRTSTTTGASGSSPVAGTTGPDRAVTVVRLAKKSGVESSGVIALTDDLFAVVDDETGSDSIVVVDASGDVVRRVDVTGMRLVNAEALASGWCGAQECVAVGDIGDNAARRAKVSIYVIPRTAVIATTGARVVAQRWDYTYVDGPRNAEAMFFDATGRVVIITKEARTQGNAVAPHRIYRGGPGGGDLALVATFALPAPAIPTLSLLVGNVVTDASYDGGRVLLLTYDQLLEYRAPAPAADPTGFADWPRRALPMPLLAQAEGVSSLPDGCGYAIVSEAAAGDRGSLAVGRCAG